MSPSADPPREPRRDALAAQAAELVAALRSEAEQPPAKQPVRPNGNTRVRVLAATLGAIVVVAGVWLTATSRWLRGRPTVPRDLIGVWRTEVPSHADRAFEITDSTLILHTGGTDSTVSRITDLKSRAVADGVDYTIEYLVEGEHFLFPFTLTAGPDQAIRFRNQPRLIWHKQP